MIIRTSRLSYLAPAKGRAGHDVLLLKDVTVSIPAVAATSSLSVEVGKTRHLSGVVTAVVGPSGSGKTTLLRLLGAQPMRGKVCGHVYHGSATVIPTSAASAPDALSPAARVADAVRAAQQQSQGPQTPRIAYVAPPDVHYRDLTFEETLYYAARLTLPYSFTEEDVRSRYMEIAQLLRLEEKLGTRVGAATTSLLDLRLLSLAEALLSPADALLVEDPMHDLDAVQCLNAAAALRDVARSACIAVVYALHGSASEVFAYCDRAVMLRKGAVLYEGEISLFESFLRTALSNPEDLRALEQSGMHPVSFILRGAAQLDRVHTREWGVSESDWSRQLEVIAVYNDKSRSATVDSMSDGMIPNYSFGVGAPSHSKPTFSAAQAMDNNNGVDVSEPPRDEPQGQTLEQKWIPAVRRVRNKLCSPVPPILSVEFFWQMYILFKRSLRVYFRSIFGARLAVSRSIILGIIVGVLYYESGLDFNESSLVWDPINKFNEYSYNLFSLMSLICLLVVFMAGTSIPAYYEVHRVCQQELRNSWYHPFASVLATMAVDTPILITSTVAFSAIVYRMAELRGPESWFYAAVVALACVGYSQARFCVAAARDPIFAFMLFVNMWAFESMLAGFMIPESSIKVWDWALDINFPYWGVRLLENNEFEGFNEPIGDLLLNAFGFLDTNKMDCIAYMFIFFVLFIALYAFTLYPKPQRLRSISTREMSRILMGMLALSAPDDDSVVQDEKSQQTRLSIKMGPVSTRSGNSAKSSLNEPLSQGGSSFYQSDVSGMPVMPVDSEVFSKPVRASPAWTWDAMLRYAYDAAAALVQLAEMLVHVSYDYSHRAVVLEHRLRPMDNANAPRKETTAASPAISRLTLAPDQRVTIAFHKLSYSLPIYKLQRGVRTLVARVMAKVSDQPVKEVSVLKHVSGVAKSAELCLVLGVPHSGKATLFKVLSEAFRCANTSDKRVKRRGVQGGSIYVNGSILAAHNDSVSGSAATRISAPRASTGVPVHANENPWADLSFVACNDTLNAMLTVREHLRYSLLLRRRLSVFMSSKEDVRAIEVLVDDLLILHSLDKVSDSRVGVPQHRNLTQGQMRRLAIAVGVSGGSPIVFLSAPLADLSHECATSVSACLQALASSGRTVICSATGMSAMDVKLFNRMLLLHDGYSLYSGRTQDFASYMANRFSLVPGPKQSIADFALALSAGDLLKQLVVDNRDKQEQQQQLTDGGSAINPPPPATNATAGLFSDTTLEASSSVLAMITAVDEEVFIKLAHSYSISRPTDMRKSVLPGTIPEPPASRWKLFGHEALTLLDRDARSVLRRPYWIVVGARAAILGVLVGSIFYNTREDDAVSRMGLFFAAHMVVNLWVVELVPAMHAEKSAYYREVRSGVLRGPLASTLVMGLPAALVTLLLTALFCAPLYFLGNLRSGAESFMNFYAAVLLSQLYNIALAYLVAFSTSNVWTNLIVYPGLFVPICWSFSGYLVLYSTLSGWLQWIVRVDYCFWYMSAAFANEFRSASGILIEGIVDIYGYTEAVPNSLGYMAVALLVVRLLHLVAMGSVVFADRRSAYLYK